MHREPMLPSPDARPAAGTDAQSSDVTLCTTLDGKEFPANKSILSMKSPVFATLLSDEAMQGNVFKLVFISDVSGVVLEAFLAYINTGDVGGVAKFPVELLELAVKVCLQ